LLEDVEQIHGADESGKPVSSPHYQLQKNDNDYKPDKDRKHHQIFVPLEERCPNYLFLLYKLLLNHIALSPIE
jgi:hypothetical protein